MLGPRAAEYNLKRTGHSTQMFCSDHHSYLNIHILEDDRNPVSIGIMVNVIYSTNTLILGRALFPPTDVTC
jgi:hypothetical protein